MSPMSRVRTLATLAATSVILAAGGGAALADAPIVDGDSALPITSSGVIAFGSVCIGSTASTSRLVAANRVGGGQVWADGAELTATATATGGASTSVTDASITLPSNWDTLANNTLASDTASVTLALAPTAPGAMGGSFNVTLTGDRSGGGTLDRSASVPWTATAVTCNTAPTITVNDVTLQGNTSGGRTLAFADIGSAGDAEDAGGPTVTCSPAIGSVLPLGVTTVTCQAKDSGNLVATDSGAVTVVDTVAPVISGTPSSITLEATSAAGASHTYTSPTASDVVSGTVGVTCTPASGSTFPVGPTTVSCTASDGAGNTSSTSFQVNVSDTTKPVFAQPEDVTVEATSAAGALATYTVPSATDAVSGTIPGTCDPASGGQFPLGDTTVECSATDAAGNEGTTSFVVHVVDTTAPEVDVPSDMTVEATSGSGAAVTYTASATDAVDADPAVHCTPASGSTFGLGTTTVTCTATDGAGNSADDSFTVTVQDTTDPTLEEKPDVVVEGNTTGGALTAYTAPTATDAVDPDPVVECTPLESAFFALGETTVTCTATDGSGNVATDSFTVTVVDTKAPTLSDVPGDRTVEGNTAGGATVSFTAPTATDVVDADPTVTCTPASGATFPLGTTTVTCSATDDSGNTSSEVGFDVTVVDTTDPTITHVSTLPTPNADGWNSSDVTVTWSCSDIVGVVDASVTQVLADEGANQSATGTCTDTSGNTASDTQTGIDIDETGPSALLAVTAGTLGDNGWYRSNVTVGTSGSDDLSGPPTCTADQFLNVDSTGTEFTGSCTNLAGLTTVADPITVKRDTVAPTISAGSPSGTTGANGWYTSAVTSPFTATDTTSGVQTGFASFGVSSGGAEGAAVTIASGPVKDNAGNEAASITVGPFKVDLSNPTDVAFVGGPAAGSSHYFGSVPSAPTCTASDAVSGLASCVVTGHSTAVGTHTMTATATDHAGRTATATRSYTVAAWTGAGFYQPVDMGGVVNTVKAGSTVPLKFELFAGSTELTSTSAVGSFKVATINCATLGTLIEDSIELTTTGGTSLRYDSTGGQFVQNWQTPKSAGTCYSVTMTAADGVTKISANFKLK